MFMKKYVIGLTLLLAALFGGWYYASPSLALKGLRDAVTNNDVAGLESRIDFPALRAAAKGQMKQKLSAEMKKPGAPDLGILGDGLADKLLDKVVDGVVTPAGIAQMMKSQGKGAEDADAPASSLKADTKEPDYQIERSGISEFRVSNPKDKNSPVLIFTRHGLGWKLSNVDLSKLDLDKSNPFKL
jgi:hypothetical protein